MDEFHIKKPEIDNAEIVECPKAGDEVMDPVGYFLIRVNNKDLEAGLCDYDKVNVIKRVWKGQKPQDVYQKIIADMPEIMREHCSYLAKELTRAWICMKLGVKYVQDGKMDGTFPEIEWLNKKDNVPV